MKKLILILSLILLAFQFVFSNSEKTSKIVFYRENSIYGTTLSYKVFVGDSMVVKLKNNSFYSFTYLPGEYVINIENFENTKLTLKVEEGKTYYVRFAFKSVNYKNTPELLLVDKISADPIINSGELRNLAVKHSPKERKKNRFGAYFDFAYGIERQDFKEITKKEHSYFSFGGGTSYGLKYSYEVNKHFDLSGSISHRSAFKSFYDSNYSMSFHFKRAIIHVTPALIIPIDGGDIMRLKLGAGMNYHFYSNLKIDKNYNKIDKFFYEDSFGYHFSLIFEFNTTEKISFAYGLKYDLLTYTYDELRLPQPTHEKFRYPNGSGIDFNMAIYYNF